MLIVSFLEDFSAFPHPFRAMNYADNQHVEMVLKAGRVRTAANPTQCRQVGFLAPHSAPGEVTRALDKGTISQNQVKVSPYSSEAFFSDILEQERYGGSCQHFNNGSEKQP